MSRSRPDIIFPRLVDHATVSKNRCHALQPTQITRSRAVTAIPNHAKFAMRRDLDLEIEVKSTSNPIKINFNFV